MVISSSSSTRSTPTSASSSVNVNSLLDQLGDKILEEEIHRRGIHLSTDINHNNNINSDIGLNIKIASSSSSILCCIAIHEEAYIDEFVDYHLGIGFRKVIVYDNSDHYELKQWGDERNRRRRRKQRRVDGKDSIPSISSNDLTVTNDHANDIENNEVHVIHFPGKGKQRGAYLDCAKRAYRGEFGTGIENAAFWDVDEFLILKQHTTIDELLEEYMVNKGASSLSINWHTFRQGNRNVYEPLPVTKRFLYREREVQRHVKSMVRLEDMDMTTFKNGHYPQLLSEKIRIDTNGTELPESMFNYNGPNNVAILNHYNTKSYAEYIKKRERGRAAAKDWNPDDRHPGYEKRLKEAVDEYVGAMQKYNYTSSYYDEGTDGGDDDDISSNGTTVYDDTAWAAMKRVCPKYALYDLLNEI